MSRKRTLALWAAAAGIGVGGATAALLPAAESAAPGGQWLAPSQPLRTAPTRETEQRPTNEGRLSFHMAKGTMREVERPDPAGGPAWVLRVFEAEHRFADRRRKRTFHNPMVCAQLVRRLPDGRAGWIDGDNVFRPVTALSYSGAPKACNNAPKRSGGGRLLKIATILDRPTSGQPRVRGSVIFGFGGAWATGATLTAGGRTTEFPQSAPFTPVLAFAGPDRSAADARLTIRRAEGRPVVETLTRDPRPSVMTGPEQDRADIDWSSQRVIARAPDPGGGPSWGVTGAQTRDGRWCTGLLGNLVDGHVGEISGDLGLLLEASPERGRDDCTPEAGPTPTRPVQLNVSSSGGPFEDLVAIDRGVGEQRLQSGRTVLWGRTAPGVVSVTIATPRDIRTLEPAGAARGLLAVYDGTFPSGDARLTVRFRDGTVREQRSMLGSPW